MRFSAAKFFLLVGLSSALLWAQQTTEVDLRNPAEVQKEVQRIQKKYPGDPMRAAEEVRRLTERVAEANGVLDKLREIRAKDEVLKGRYGVPDNYTNIPATHDEPGKTIDFSAWQWKMERQPGKYILTFTLDKSRYKTPAKALPTVVLRRKGKTLIEEEDLQHGVRMIDNIHINLAFENLGTNAYRTEFWIPDAEVDTYVIQVSLVLEREWETCGVIPLKRK